MVEWTPPQVHPAATKPREGGTLEQQKKSLQSCEDQQSSYGDRRGRAEFGFAFKGKLKIQEVSRAWKLKERSASL